MNYTLAELEGMVAEGVRFLDQAYPEWVNAIDPSIFSIRSPELCVLGQITKALMTPEEIKATGRVGYYVLVDLLVGGGWKGTCHAAFPFIRQLKMTQHDAIARGFNLEGSHDEDWSNLDRTWLGVIMTRIKNKEKNS